MEIESGKLGVVYLLLFIIGIDCFVTAAPRLGRQGSYSPISSSSSGQPFSFPSSALSTSTGQSPSVVSSQRSNVGSLTGFQLGRTSSSGSFSSSSTNNSMTPSNNRLSNTSGRSSSSSSGLNVGRSSTSRVAVSYPSVPLLSVSTDSSAIGPNDSAGARGSREILPEAVVPTNIPAQPVTANSQGAADPNLNARNAVEDWMAGLFNRNSSMSQPIAADTFDPVKAVNVNCDAAEPFPSADFAAQNDTSKVYLTPAELPPGSKFTQMGFDKFISVFGIPLLGTKEVGDISMIHGAKVAAELLDNDSDGLPDNIEVIKSLLKYVVVIGYVSNADESDVFWRERYMNPSNAGFREQYVCNIYFFEHWAEDVSPRYAAARAGMNSDEINSGSECRDVSFIPFDWSLWYHPFAIAYYGYFDQLSAETKDIIKKKMDKALLSAKYSAQYPEDPEMELTGFLIWSFLANSGALSCHCNANGIAGVWDMCTGKDLYEFDPEWVKFLDDFPFFPTKLPLGQYSSPATVPLSYVDSSANAELLTITSETEDRTGIYTPGLNLSNQTLDSDVAAGSNVENNNTTSLVTEGSIGEPYEVAENGSASNSMERNVLSNQRQLPEFKESENADFTATELSLDNINALPKEIPGVIPSLR